MQRGHLKRQIDGFSLVLKFKSLIKRPELTQEEH